MQNMELTHPSQYAVVHPGCPCDVLSLQHTADLMKDDFSRALNNGCVFIKRLMQAEHHTQLQHVENLSLCTVVSNAVLGYGALLASSASCHDPSCTSAPEVFRGAGKGC